MDAHTPQPITVKFSPNIKPDGVVTCVTIEQDGDAIHMTKAQVHQLVQQLMDRFPLVRTV